MAEPLQPSSSKRLKQNDSVIATNNSSIVSKRSVERLYYPEPHFYRYFVKKPLRRSPLINRGYWLRMHAIEQVIKQFLDEPSDKQKIVLNLGCGYDPLAFQWLSKDPLRCQKTKFVDVDFPELVAKKREIIIKTPQLRDLLKTPRDDSGIHLRSEHYSALGCDLTDVSKLDALLATEMNPSDSLILCTAEVSVTYMDGEAADSLIRWAAQHDHVRFCLLEQHLPDGAQHPFAQKMIQHFNNLNTPLRSVHKYPKLRDQELRFRQRGWSLATARSLWDLWSDPLFVSPERRIALDSVEPFDEWEEFVLFSSHYFLLIAASSPSPNSSPFIHSPDLQQLGQRSGNIEQWTRMPMIARYEPIQKAGRRRFGALISASSNVFGHHGGLGSQTRLGTMDLYGPAVADIPIGLDSAGIQPRMCHSITALNESTSLLVGGRTSPVDVLKDCWVLRECWVRVDDLPISLFRHSATQVDVELTSRNHTGVLIYGGKTDGNKVSDQWMLWREGVGWIQLNATGHDLTARFGAAMASTGPGVGILVGGMGSDGMIMAEVWEWSIFGGEELLGIALKPVEVLAEAAPPFESDLVPPHSHCDSSELLTRNIIGRLGACLIKFPSGALLIGGVSVQNPAQDLDFVRLTKGNANESGKGVWHCIIIDTRWDAQQPLLVGHSSFLFQDYVVIVGGGAVCFSFGTYWSDCLITLSLKEGDQTAVIPLSARKAEQGPTHTVRREVNLSTSSPAVATRASIVKSERIASAQDFECLVDQGRPVIFRNNQLGSCTSHWTVDSLKEKLGPDRTVVVHEAFDTHMDFQKKNFCYVKKPFKDFIEEISGGSQQYLRSLASNDPSETPADFWADFPDLGADFELPLEYDTVKRNMHSSVLRISGPIAMWLHYDVMANVLCQIQGNKRIILYPPSDVSLFAIPPGTSSSSVNCFDPNTLNGHSLISAHPQEALVGPGDVLFIPPLWLHTASPIDTVSVSVNVFFRNLEHGYAPGRDVYGNRDFQAYEKGRKDIDKIAKSFDKLPPDIGRFYLERLADELRTKALRHSL